MLNFKLIFQSDELIDDFKEKENKIYKILWDLVEDLGDVLESKAQETIFNSSQKGFQRKSGDFQRIGLERKFHKVKSKNSSSVSGHYWSEAGNLFERFKQRQRVRLYAPLKKYFEQDSKFNSLIENAIERFNNG